MRLVKGKVFSLRARHLWKTAEGEMTLEELTRRTKEFEIFYNKEYPHSALGYKSPREYYNEVMVYQKCV